MTTSTTGDRIPADRASGSAPERLRTRELRLGYRDRVVVDGVDLAVPDRAVTAVIGPNGCGKSTLLRGLGRLLAPRGGQVLLDGRELHRLPSRLVAETLGVLPQSPRAPDGLTVGELVTRGRYPHQRWYRPPTAADRDAVTDALRRTGMLSYADRALDQLSGGQRQRAWLALTLAQGTELLLLDEPTTYLDLAHALDVLDLVRQLGTEDGRTVVVVLHDLNLAARYADHVVALYDGRIVAQGAPADVLTAELLAEVFALDARVVPDPVAGTPLVVPVGSRHHRT